MSTQYLGIDIGIRNFSICHVEVGENSHITIKRWELVDFLEGTEFKNADHVHVHDIHALMYFWLPKLFPSTEVLRAIHHVKIEAQPLGKYANQKTTLISHLVYQHFFQLLQNIRYGQTLATVTLTSPSQKYKKSWLSKFNFAKGKSHASRKALSVKLLNAFIKNPDYIIHNNTSVVLSQCPKKDDYADSFLLAMCTTL